MDSTRARTRSGTSSSLGTSSRALLVSSLLFAAACGGSSSSSAPPPPTDPPADLSYPARLVVMELDEELAPLAPAVTGTVSSWSISPELPAGLVFSGTTGAISGTAAATQPRTRHTITATNAAGSTQTMLDIEVLGIPRFLFVLNEGDSTLSRLSIEDADPHGLLHAGYHALEDPHLGPQQIVLHPSGLFAYTAIGETEKVLRRVFDAAEGGVSTGGELIDSGPSPNHLAMHPSGERLYVTASSTDVPRPIPATLRTFDIEGSTGALTLLDVLEDIPANLQQIVLDPEGRFLVTVHSSPGAVYIHPLDEQGIPSLGTPVELSGAQPVSAAFGPLGEQLYIATTAPVGSILVFDLETDGTLAPAGSHPVDDIPGTIAVHPEGRALYVTRSSAGDIRRFAMDPLSGTLGSVVDGGEAPSGSHLFVDERGRMLLVVDELGNELYVVHLDLEDGEMGSTRRMRTRQAPRGVVLIRGSAPLKQVTQSAYVVSFGDDVVRVLDVTGAGISVVSDVSAGPGPLAIALAPQQRLAFVLDAQLIRSFRIESNGDLTDLAVSTPVGPAPVAIQVDPSGSFLFLLDSQDNRVTPYAIQADTGALVAGSFETLSTMPLALGVEPTGQFLYVANDGGPGNSFIRALVIDPRTGALSSSGTPGTVQGEPTRMGFSPSAHALYLALRVTDVVAQYILSASAGSASHVSPAAPVQADPTDVVVHPNGLHAYVAVRNPGAEQVGRIYVFDVDPLNGALGGGGGPGIPKQTLETSQFRPRRLAVPPSGDHIYLLLEGVPNGWFARAVIASDGLLATPGNVTNAGAMSQDFALRWAFE